MDQAVSVREDATRSQQNPDLRKSEAECSKVKCRTDKTKAESAQSVLPGARKAEIRCSKIQLLETKQTGWICCLGVPPVAG